MASHGESRSLLVVMCSSQLFMGFEFQATAVTHTWAIRATDVMVDEMMSYTLVTALPMTDAIRTTMMNLWSEGIVLDHCPVPARCSSSTTCSTRSISRSTSARVALTGVRAM